MKRIEYIDRVTQELREEKVFGKWAVQALYGGGWGSFFLRVLLLSPICRLPWFSRLYGWWQRQFWTRRKIRPFIKAYDIDPEESLLSPEAFPSFDAFFSRRLKPERRPFSAADAMIPVDGRFWAYPNLSETEGVFGIKGALLSLEQLVGSSELAFRYREGAAVFGRLCPSDYHRFHFPCKGVAQQAVCLNGALYSVNPLAIRRNVAIYSENKRFVTRFSTSPFGEILLLEIGATNVGSVHQTYEPGKWMDKGEEKGYFSFGGSAIVVLFLPNRIRLDADLVEATRRGLEIRCLLGQSLGMAILN